MSNYSQLQRQRRDEIQNVILNQREKMQRKIDKNSNRTILNKIDLVNGELKKKCQFCDQQGIQEDILKHMKNSHTDDFLNLGDNINKYSKCRVCKKLLSKKNIEEHQLKCEIKENNRKDAREDNKLRKQKRRNQYCQEINDEEDDENYNNILKKFGIKTEVDPNYIIQSQESNYSQSESKTSFLNSGIFKTKKKLKTNEEREENELTFQTMKKIPLKQPIQSQNESYINFMGELNNDIPIVQQEEQKSSIDKFVAAEALARENKIKQINQEKERVERKSILERSKSRDKSLKQKQIINQTQQKLQETAEQKQKKELEATINKLKQQQQINKKNLDKLDNTQMLNYYNEMKQNEFDKILEKTNHKEKDALDQIFIDIQHELNQLQNQKQIVSKDSEEEIDEVADKNKQKAKELDSEIKQIKEQINELKQQKQQFPDDEDVINREIQRLIEQKGLLKKEYEDLTGKQYLEHAEEKRKNVKKQIDSDQSEDDDNQSNQTGQFYKMFNKFGKKN
ncbi:hypothetical protein ABPG72_012103 [Tetrahymena utriculariae]